MRIDQLHPDSFVGHGDREADTDSAVAPVIHQTATFRASSDEEFAAMADTPRHDCLDRIVHLASDTRSARTRRAR